MARSVPDNAWEGFEAFLVAAVDLQASDRGFKDALAARGRDERRVKAARRKLHTAVERLVDRGHADGALRDDMAVEDVSVLLWATARIVERTADIAPASRSASSRCTSTACARPPRPGRCRPSR